MTQEEKARAYDEVRNKIAIRFGTNVAEEIFSQFEESEDERIRKGIIEYLEQSQFGEEHYCVDDDIVRGYITWLEKQGEQKPTKAEPIRRSNK